MSWFIIILNILELATALTGFLFWKKIKDSHWKWFPIYLGIIFLTEMTGEYFLHVKADLKTNIAVYSYFGIPVQFFFFYWLFHQQFKNTNKSKWPLISAAVYFISLVADLLYISKIQFYFESFSYVIGCVFLLVLILIYFNRFIKSDEIIRYKSSMKFWVCIGLLVFYVGAMPFFAFRKALYVDNKDFFYIYWYAQFGLNYLMYLFFIISFIWGKPK
ncbi:MAG: hypothetical protein IPL84_13030 [Chitinophagaceae bacterium]|nr:hypothetical protein [Chitinophagaceae bacterium]